MYVNYFKYIFYNMKCPKLKLVNLVTEDFFLVLICWHHGLP